MLKSLYSHFILRDPLAEGSGSVTNPVVDVNSGPKGGTTQEPPPAKEPPASELAKDFKIEDFDTFQLEPTTPSKDDKDKGQTTNEKEIVKKTVPPKEEPKVEEVKKDEKKGLEKYLKPPVKAGEKADTKTTGKEVVKPVIVPTNTRDYTGFKEDEIPVLKQMSNQAFDYVKKLRAENSELSKYKDTQYLQHEKAYLLDPQYNEVRTDLQYAQVEANIWKQQLLLIQQAKPWRPLESFDKNGNPVYGTERQPTPEDAIEVQRVYNQLNNIAAQKAGELEKFPTQYKNRVTEDTRLIENEIKQRFEWEQKPEMLDHTLPITFEDGVRDVSIRQIREDFTNLFPPYMRNQLGVKVAANMMVSMRIGEMMLADATATKTVEKTVEEEQSRVEPTTNGRPANNGKVLKDVNGVKEFSLAGIENL